jgi:hypothetical protein
MAIIHGVVEINGHDYTRYVKQLTGLGWSRENTNEKDAGRDEDDVMHTNVRSQQRKLTMKMGPMPFEVAMQLEADLEGGDDGVTVRYPDLKDGICRRLFYNTSITAAEEQFTDDGIVIDNVNFTLISVKEATV